VREVVDMVSEIVGEKIPLAEASRRPGDPPELVAAASSAARILPGWKPKHDLRSIVSTALRWRSSHPSGYGSGGNG